MLHEETKKVYIRKEKRVRKDLMRIKLKLLEVIWHVYCNRRRNVIYNNKLNRKMMQNKNCKIVFHTLLSSNISSNTSVCCSSPWILKLLHLYRLLATCNFKNKTVKWLKMNKLQNRIMISINLASHNTNPANIIIKTVTTSSGQSLKFDLVSPRVCN